MDLLGLKGNSGIVTEAGECTGVVSDSTDDVRRGGLTLFVMLLSVLGPSASEWLTLPLSTADVVGEWPVNELELHADSGYYTSEYVKIAFGDPRTTVDLWYVVCHSCLHVSDLWVIKVTVKVGTTAKVVLSVESVLWSGTDFGCSVVIAVWPNG